MTEHNGNVLLFGKLAKVMGKLERLPKRGHNAHFNYDFVTDGDVSDAVRRALAKEGIAFFASLDSITQEGKKTIAQFTYTFADETGATYSCQWAGEAIDGQDKGIAKAATSALKYFLLKTFMLSTGDPMDDTDASVNGNGTEPQAQPQTAAQYKKAFFARVLTDIPYYNHDNHVANTLKQLGIKTYKYENEDDMFQALQQHASEKANEEAKAA